VVIMSAVALALVSQAHKFAQFEQSVTEGSMVTRMSALGPLVAVTPRIFPPTMQLLHGVAAMATVTVGFVTLLHGPVLLVALLGQAVAAVISAVGIAAWFLKENDVWADPCRLGFVLPGLLAGQVGPDDDINADSDGDCAETPSAALGVG